MQKVRGALIVLAVLAGLGLVLYSGTDRRVGLAFFIGFAVLLAWALQFNRVGQFESNSYSTRPDRKTIRRIMCWAFAFMCLRYVLDPRVSMLYAIHRHYAFLPFRNLLTIVLYTATPVISGVAAWLVWTRKSSARVWAITASITYILIFIRSILFVHSSAWWRHLGVLGLGIMGLVGFLPRDEQIDSAAPPKSVSA